MSSGSVTVLTVDDQARFRRAARRLIAATPGFEQVAEAASGQEALALADDLDPDLVLLDVRMPGMDGIETARRLHARHHATVVVLVSLQDIPDLPLSLESIGATAYVRKQDLSTHSLQAVWTGRRAPSPPE
jgi:two-component system, NarL family, invasion response regulator UvrY